MKLGQKCDKNATKMQQKCDKNASKKDKKNKKEVNVFFHKK